MTRIEERDGVLVVTQGTWLFVSMGLFYAGLALAAAAVLVVRADVRVIPGAAVLGIVGGFLMTRPLRRVATLRPGRTATLEVRTLFGTRRREVEDVTGVALIVGTYRAYVDLRFRDDPPETVLTTLKTWTWQRDSAQARGWAGEIARFLGLPLE